MAGGGGVTFVRLPGPNPTVVLAGRLWGVCNTRQHTAHTCTRTGKENAFGSGYNCESRRQRRQDEQVQKPIV
jgi:hypothetical protein